MGNIKENFNTNMDPVGQKVLQGLMDPLSEVMESSELLISYYDDYSREEILGLLGALNLSIKEVERRTKKMLLKNCVELSAYDSPTRKVLSKGITSDSAVLIREIAAKVAMQYGRSNDLLIKDIDNTSLALPQHIFTLVIGEVLHNAFQYSDEGSVIKIVTHIHDHEYIVYVEDAGFGLDAERISQLGQSPWENSTGMGLGLFLSASLLKINGGNIIIEPNDGKQSGTIVKIMFKTN